MPSKSKKIPFAGLTFDVWENVYEPAEDSFFFAENLAVKRESHVLDLGTGCGILGIIAAASNAWVTASDINPFSVRCAKGNALLNKVIKKMQFVHGDLLYPIRRGENFDLILFNTPYLPTEADENLSWLARAWTGGTTGRRILDRFISDVPEYLKPDGSILMMQSTLSNVEETLRRFEKNHLQARVIAEKNLPFFESLVLIGAECVGRKRSL